MPRAVAARTPPAPRSLTAAATGPAAVRLRWKAPAGAGSRKLRYLVLRDGKALGKVTGLQYVDTAVKPGGTHRYAVCVWTGSKRGKLSRTVSVALPKAAGAPAGAAPVGVVPGVAPAVVPSTSVLPADGGPAPVTPDPGPSTPTPQAVMSDAMVQRLFWRAGFGPSAADRAAWTGKPVADLVNWMLTTPQSYRATTTPPLTSSNAAIDPLAATDDLISEWVDGMARAVNPLLERLAFFWHRHWAVNRFDGIPLSFLLAYRDRLRRGADVATNPGLSFRQLATEMTTADAAMSLFLNQSSNVKGSVNENYARELMELFCLGLTDVDGTPNYTQADVSNLARAFTGWRLDQTPTSATYGQITFKPTSSDTASKTIFGQTGAFTTAQGIELVLAHRSHAPFLVRKLWAEFVNRPIPQTALDTLVAAYTAGGRLELKPVLRGILTHPLLFASLDEPDMVKPPVVHGVGVLRALDAPLKGTLPNTSLNAMQQQPYAPPNVAGWEGGLSWLTSSTAVARFDFVVRCVFLKHGSASASSYPGSAPVDDVVGETAAQAFDRAYAAAGSPWASPATLTQLKSLAGTVAAATPADRRQRQYVLRTLLLGGPDAQVM